MPDLLAERVGWPLRGAEGDYVAARLEQGSKAHTLSAKMQKKEVPVTLFPNRNGVTGTSFLVK
jgi:hypothetical protein